MSLHACLILPPGSAQAAASDAAEALVLASCDAAALAGLRRRPPCPRLLVRLDPIGSPDFEAHLHAAVAARPDALVLPAAHGREVADLGARLAVAEAEHGLPDGGIGILALAARAEAVLAAQIFVEASPRLIGLGWDAQALAAQVGAPAPWAGGGWIAPLAQGRALVRLAAAAAGIPAVEAAYPGADAQGCRAAVAAARRDGFAAMMARDAGQAALIRAET